MFLPILNVNVPFNNIGYIPLSKPFTPIHTTCLVYHVVQVVSRGPLTTFRVFRRVLVTAWVIFIFLTTVTMVTEFSYGTEHFIVNSRHPINMIHATIIIIFVLFTWLLPCMLSYIIIIIMPDHIARYDFCYFLLPVLLGFTVSLHSNNLHFYFLWLRIPVWADSYEYRSIFLL